MKTTLSLNLRYRVTLTLSGLLLLVAIGIYAWILERAEKEKFQTQLLASNLRIQEALFEKIQLAQYHANAMRRAAERVLAFPDFAPQQANEILQPFTDNAPAGSPWNELPKELKSQVGALHVDPQAELSEFQWSRMLSIIIPMAPEVVTEHEQRSIFQWSYFYDAQRRWFWVYPAMSHSELLLSTETSDIHSAIKVLFDEENTAPVSRTGPVINPSRNQILTQPYLDFGGKGMMVSFISPVYLDDVHIGTVGTDLTLNILDETFKDFPPFSGRALVFDQNQNVLADSGGALADKNELIPLEQIMPDFSYEMVSVVNAGQIYSDGKGYWIHYPIHKTDWIFLVFVSSAEMNDFLSQRTRPYVMLSMAVMVSLLLLAWIQHRRYTRPALQLAQYINEIAYKPCDIPKNIPSIWTYWFDRALQTANERKSLLDKTHQHALELEIQANHDELTSLKNRYFLIHMTPPWLIDASIEAAMLYIDVNNFKSANDYYGHKVGDELLKVMANRLKTVFNDGTVIRFGSDDFVVFLIGCDEQALYRKCNAFQNLQNQSVEIGNISFSLSASIGVSRYPNDGSSMEELLRKADIAMHEAKSKKISILFFSSELEEKQKRRSEIEKELEQAIENNELSLVYQPQISAAFGNIVGVEALIRWNNRRLGFVSPDEFINIAEANGQIIRIGEFVCEQSFRDIDEICRYTIDKEKQSAFHINTPRLSINVSVQQLFHDSFPQYIKKLLEQYEKDAFSVVIEITESLFIEDVQRARSILSKFREMGIGVSLDDFGTGYSSLSILNTLPIDELKIDKSFIRGILDDPHSQTLIQSIIDIGKNLSIPVLAEGVEEKLEVDMLSQFDCDVFQGYYFSKPLTKAQFLEFIENYPEEALSRQAFK